MSYLFHFLFSIRYNEGNNYERGQTMSKYDLLLSPFKIGESDIKKPYYPPPHLLG